MIDRRQFLRHAALCAASIAGGVVLLPNLSEMLAHADPASRKMLVGPLDQAVNIRALQCATSDDTCSNPRLLVDGRYALPVGALGDPKYSASEKILSGWSVKDIDSTDYDSEAADSSDFLFSVDNRLMRHGGRPSSLTMPGTGVFRFEVHADDFAGPYDTASGSRRSEIISRRQDGIGEETVWSSFCLILGSTPGLSQSGRGIVHQWHSSDIDVGRTPGLFIDVANSKFTIRTCSSANLYGGKAAGPLQRPESGMQTVHFSTETPEVGARTFITLQATFGKNGHLNAWINGAQVVDTDTPIGYYDDLADNSGRTILGYPHWGLYTLNQPEVEEVYIANPEWGKNSLSDRIDNPLPVSLDFA